MPAKILDTPSWTELSTWKRTDRAFPVTQDVYNRAAEDIASTDNILWKVAMWVVHSPAMVVAPLVDAVWAPLNTAVNWYKKLYNVWADLYNRAENAVLDKKIANTKPQPTWQRMPQQPKAPADAATDAELWEATHQFGYWNDPRTVYQRYRNWKKKTVTATKKPLAKYKGNISL